MALGLGVREDRIAEAERPFLAKYAADLRSAGYSPVTVAHYLKAATGGLTDPVNHVAKQTRYGMWSWARAAMIAYAKMERRYDLIAAIQVVPPPPKPPKKVIRVPDEQTWVMLGDLAAKRGPIGLACVLWMVYYSGMRIGAILRTTREQAQEVIRKGSTAVLDKGRGGAQERLWRPGARVRRALRVLLKSPGWQVVWQTVADGQEAAAAKVRQAIPKPYHPHCFRHKVAQELVGQNIHPRVIMEFGGWRSLTSLTIYLDNVKTSLVDNANLRLDAAIERASDKARRNT